MLAWLRKSLGLAPKIDLRAFDLVSRSVNESLDPSVPAVWSDLTAREQQAAILVFRGLSIEEICREMARTRPGVYRNIQSAMQKSGTLGLSQLKDWTGRNMPSDP